MGMTESAFRRLEVALSSLVISERSEHPLGRHTLASLRRRAVFGIQGGDFFIKIDP